MIGDEAAIEVLQQEVTVLEQESEAQAAEIARLRDRVTFLEGVAHGFKARFDKLEASLTEHCFAKGPAA